MAGTTYIDIEGYNVPASCVKMEYLQTNVANTFTLTINSACVKIDSLNFPACGITTMINLNAFMKLQYLNLFNNALSSAEVNAILTSIDTYNTSTYPIRQIFLNGGTNGAPSGAGITAKASLIAKGWAVTTN